MKLFPAFVSSTLTFSSVVNCVLSSVSRQVSLGVDSYFLPPTKSWSIRSWDVNSIQADDEFLPLTVVQCNDSKVDEQTLKTTFDTYLARDDVWTPEFANALFLQCPKTKLDLDKVKGLAPEYSINNVFYGDFNQSSIENVPIGPYFVHKFTGDVYRAYKLVNDFNQAFIQSSYQDEQGFHHPLAAASMSAGALTIGLPSRLYFTRTPEQPLAGFRVAVKDLYDLQGLKTSGGNRAFYTMATATNVTAYPVQRLIDAGAVVIGKNHLSEFAFAGPDMTEHVDYLLPFNPRGDGYNSPDDSSGGSGAAVASYDWLDVSLGSDTGGSIRSPACKNGVMGSRPSTGAVDLTGVLSLSTTLDTAGVLVRDPSLWSDINKVLYAGFAKEYPSFPKKVYVQAEQIASYANATGDEAAWAQQALSFVTAMAKAVGANVAELSIDSLWNSTNGVPHADGQRLASFSGALYQNITMYEQWNDWGRRYVESWMADHDGEFPAMVPNTRGDWLTVNESITPDLHQQHLSDVQSVRQWAADHFLRPDNESCSDAVYLYFSPPDGNVNYKPNVAFDLNNVYIKELLTRAAQAEQAAGQLNVTLLCGEDNSNTSGATCLEARQILADTIQQIAQLSPTYVNPGRIASLAGLPDYVITLGEMAMNATMSESTLKLQSMPWSVDIMAAAGCDFMLQDLISELSHQGLIKPVKTGAHVH
ncbi:hypothetical protein Z517_02213 [Fonsecaea pedrosoi CBS 271.37]|uniref:Unplaced genomic scaffold supercont1.2, whole genome shotgun sequence n=1 Tax=Fonsecaea pedrosoi CBS 271.37 TaxID=1442368 RepID=A0A0D2GWH6_9EURO|nr:uncharacterized protein Z517_02213 [Fonsecaea pedrosoi CBS 271.37]KIW82970.1 hypothetical protein Z517_02213 [Fonsecaea pedrosoi CBS 271.37]